ncbi:zinc finger protein 266-like [Bicyclus anynana]|uniref:Zinc finger protein 266-like n=1 Tax=Bicyclus anynana TaxID=110368 RepID=A0ABM3M3C7_BICAN|nr:zinc finger protein 266-like [Bicyclus anynana]
MQKHAKEHPLKLACLYCKFKCSKRSQLSEHLRSHDAYHRCAECGYATLARQTYEAHVRSHDKSLACYACDYVCTSAGDRAAHARTHCNEKPFQCLSCGVGFHRKYQLQRHRGERMCARANTLGQLTQLE